VKNLASTCVSSIFVVYMMAASFIFLPYYNWQYATSHGFMNWLFFGEIVATAKSFGWPFFLYQDHLGSSRTDERTSADHVIAALGYHNKAASIANKPGFVVSPSDWDTIVSYDKRALAEAEQADIGDMNKYHPGFGDHFRDEFIEGLKLIISNSDKGLEQTAPFLRGQVLLNKFGDWYIENMQRK
jgi:hypothetical protein